VTEERIERVVVEWVPGKWWVLDDRWVGDDRRGYTPVAGPFASKKVAEHAMSEINEGRLPA